MNSLAIVLYLFAGAVAFVPSTPVKSHVARSSNLHMSSALIIQNKGGGHGELGKCLSFFMVLYTRTRYMD